MTKPVSPKTMFVWNLAGSLSTGLVAVVLFLGVSRFLSVSLSDSYSFIYAIGNSLSILALFQVRNYQATDIKETYSFDTYLSTRIWTCLATVLAAIIYSYVKAFSSFEFYLLLSMVAYRVTDAISDVFQGLFQQKGHMEKAGQSLFFRNILMLFVFNYSLWLTRDLLVSMVLLLLVSVLSIIWWDIRPARQFASWNWQSLFNQEILPLLKQCLPLFIIGFLLVSVYNQPKYALNTLFKSGLIASGVQRDFNILFMTIFVMSLLTMLLRPMITNLATYFVAKNWEKFTLLSQSIFFYLLVLSTLALLGGYLVAIPILGYVYSSNLSAYKWAFMILLFGGVLGTFATVFDNLITVFRYQKFLVFSFTGAWLFSLLVTEPLVRNAGIFGAAAAYCLTMVVWLIGLIITYAIVYKKIRR